MRRLATLSIPLLLIFVSPSLFGLSVSSGALKNRRLFAIIFPDGLSFYARHDRINSVSLQKYQSGPYLVTEMVVDIADSDVLLRIYHTEFLTTSNLTQRAPEEATTAVNPNVPGSVQKLIDRGRSGADRAASNGMVVKDYPTSTHAKTAEYRVSDLAELEALYQRFTASFTGEESPADENDSQASRVNLAGTIFTVD